LHSQKPHEGIHGLEPSGEFAEQTPEVNPQRGFTTGPEVSFYIKPGDGFQLPDIMQWIKQTFAVWFNVIDGRTGHIWGDRYRSEILAGEPPEWAEEYVFAPVVCGWKAWRRIAAGGVGGGWKRGGAVGKPDRDAGDRPRTGRLAVKPPSRPGLTCRAAASHG
jgi:hypothetical protein